MLVRSPYKALHHYALATRSSGSYLTLSHSDPLCLYGVGLGFRAALSLSLSGKAAFICMVLWALVGTPLQASGVAGSLSARLQHAGPTEPWASLRAKLASEYARFSTSCFSSCGFGEGY